MDHVFTGVYQPENESSKSIGQIYQSGELESAQLNYLLPAQGEALADTVPLLEGLIYQAGTWGAKQIIADLATDSILFEYFRETGFSVLAKQRVFRCNLGWEPSDVSAVKWRLWSSEDIKDMRRLHATLVPPVIQPVEPLTRRKMLGMVYFDQDGDLKAYADLVYGPVGAWVLPFIHPQTKHHPLDLLRSLVNELPDLSGRTVYLIARSYQPWIENALIDSPANPGPEQALLVRYLAMRQRVKAEFSFGTIENGNPEPTVPLAPIRSNQD
jgi:hypothetical protein